MNAKIWNYRTKYQRKAHQEVDHIFLTLLPQEGLSVRKEQVKLCHEMLESLLDGKIFLRPQTRGYINFQHRSPRSHFERISSIFIKCVFKGRTD